MRDVGIVMPVYKQDPVYLELAISSILNQTFKDFHFVIVSDGAPSETVQCIRKAIKDDSRTTLIIKEKNEGVAKALNTGFERLMKIKEVNYLTWVSSDNIYFPTFVEKLREALISSPINVGLAYSSFRHIDKDGELIKDRSLDLFYKYQDQPKENLLDVCFIGVSFMYKKEVAAKIEGYRLEPVEDYDYWLRLTDHCEIVYIPEALMHYRKNSPLSISAQLKDSKQQQRRWRYAFQLAKLEARNRRNIPFHLTILYPVKQLTPPVINRLEAILEQTYSNYKLLIIDTTPDSSAIMKMQHIEDPRIKFISVPSMSEKEAIQTGLIEASTPFTLLTGRGPSLTSPFILSNMIRFYHQLIANGTNQIHAVTFDQNNGRVSFISLTKNLLDYGSLYQTETLKRLVQEGVELHDTNK